MLSERCLEVDKPDVRGDSRGMPEESDLPIETVDDFGRFALAELGLDGVREELRQLGAWFAQV